MNIRSDDEQSVTTALSTLSARVAILERWMRRAQRHKVVLVAIVVIAVTVSIWLLLTR
jgi:hypothetical protein